MAKFKILTSVSIYLSLNLFSFHSGSVVLIVPLSFFKIISIHSSWAKILTIPLITMNVYVDLKINKVDVDSRQ